MNSMDDMAAHVLEQARQARDARFDGRFFVGVTSTGIYCRPVCPVKLPRADNVRFFSSAAAASEAGFRPCLRCRPEAAPGSPAWQGTSTTVARGLRLIEQGALDEGSVESLAGRLGVTARHLRRLFLQHIGASPVAVAQIRRLQFAKRLLDETALPVTQIAMAAGYGSIRRFNAHFRDVYGCAPSAFRRSEVARPGSGTSSAFRLELAFRPPLDFDAVLAFQHQRAVPGIETVDEGMWRRVIRVADGIGRVRVSRGSSANTVLCEAELPSPRSLMHVVSRVRRVFDLDADPLAIDAVLGKDPVLAARVARSPGMRLPGAFDPFEVAVRAIVGQQISVKGATTVMGRIAQRYGMMCDGQLLFPDAQSLSGLDPKELPMPRQRAAAIAALAEAVAEGAVDFIGASPQSLYEALVAIRGIGPWTAQYITMRAMADPDAFLPGDLVLKKVASLHLGIEGEPALIARAEAWRPWRAYGLVHLWAMANDQGEN